LSGVFWNQVWIWRNLLAMKIAIALLLLLSGTLAGCERERDALVVNVVLPGNGIAFRVVGHRFAELAARKPRISSGRRIVVHEIYPRADKLAELISANPSIDIVICDSPEQLAAEPAFQQELADSANACGVEANCPAFIRRSLSPEKREAVQQVFRAIAEDKTY
jgi:hypothetical protein